MLRTKFNKFEDIALKVNEIANIPKIKTFDFKIDNQKLKGYQFYFRATGYVDFDANKLALYSNISVLHPYYMRGEVLINPLNNFIYIGRNDYDKLKNGEVVKLWVSQVGLDPYGRLDRDLFISPYASNRLFTCNFKSDIIKQNLFEGTSTGEIEFFIAQPENAVAVNTEDTHLFLYKFTNVGKDLLQYVEVPYVFYTDGINFEIDGDDLEHGDDWDFVPLSQRLQYITTNGLDPITLQMIVDNDGRHLRLWPGRYCNCLDWVLINVLDFDQVPVCIICGNTQYNTHQYEWNPAPKALLNKYLSPEITVA